MNILFVTCEQQEAGGVASVMRDLARDLQARGHTVMFLFPSRALFPQKTITRRGFTAFGVNLRMPFRAGRHPLITLAAFLICFPISMLALIRLIQKNKIDVINIHYPGDFFFYFGLCRRLLPITLVTSVHGADLFPNGRPSAKYSSALRLLLKLSDRIVAPSCSFKNDVSTLFPKLEQRTVSIHNSVNLQDLTSGRSEDACRVPKSPYILCVAMHNEKKGLDVLLRAFQRLRSTGTDIKLVLAGDGPLRRELENLASMLGIREHVEFLGRQGRSQVIQLLHGCEVFVLPSRSEPFGIAILEAMACKKPVVATKVGGIPEIIENHRDGVLVEVDDPTALANALVKLLRDKSLQQKIAENGYNTVYRRFRSENTGSNYEALFMSLSGSASQ